MNKKIVGISVVGLCVFAFSQIRAEDASQQAQNEKQAKNLPSVERKVQEINMDDVIKARIMWRMEQSNERQEASVEPETQQPPKKDVWKQLEESVNSD